MDRLTKTKYLMVLMTAFLLVGCNEPAARQLPGASSAQELPPPGISRTTAPQTTPTIRPQNSITPAPTTAPTNRPRPTITTTVEPYEPWTINWLDRRTYGGGDVLSVELLAENSLFARHLIRYPSDGLDIYGFANIPAIEGPLPVIIAIHGYIEPEVYNTLDYTTRYADDLARRGFLVIHPNLRNYPPSDAGENLFRVGMAVDILNLIALVRQTAGIPGTLLEKGDPGKIGLWGHSMGGGISTRVMTIDENVAAVVLYAAMSGDEQQNFEAIFDWSDGERGLEELGVPERALARISPENYFHRVRAAVSIHHGLSDELVPVQWSEDTCQQLSDVGVTVECIFYPGQPHTFWGEEDLVFMENAAIFFRENLSASNGP